MLLAQRKRTYCQNCQYPLTGTYNFCPNCGQENSDKLVAFNTLIGEFFSNYLAYDSRLVRTIPPFLFKPGYLTNEFIAGKRTKYMHPLRLYFIVSFFYFLLFSSIIVSKIDVGTRNNQATQTRENNTNTVSTDSLKRDISNEIGRKLAQAEEARIDSIVRSVGQSIPLSQDNDSATTAVVSSKKTAKNINLLEDIEWDKLLAVPGITPERVLDTIHVDKTYINLLLARQGIKIYNEKGQNIASYLVSKASVMMFLLLPFFALILKLFYVRRKRLYVEHITFTLHIHSFLFFILTIAIFIDYLWPADWIFTLVTLLILVYFVLAFRRVYKQGWIKTLAKMSVLFFTYAFTFSIFLLATIVVSLLIF